MYILLFEATQKLESWLDRLLTFAFNASHFCKNNNYHKSNEVQQTIDVKEANERCFGLFVETIGWFLHTLITSSVTLKD